MTLKRIERKITRNGQKQTDRFEIGNYKLLVTTLLETDEPELWSIFITEKSTDTPKIIVDDNSNFIGDKWVADFDFRVKQIKTDNIMTIEQMQEMIQKYQEALKVIEIIKNVFLNK